MAKKKEVNGKKTPSVPKATEVELTGAVTGKVMNDTGIVGDGALVKDAEK